PGWGQSYAGHSTKGVIYGGLFVLTGAFTVLAFMNYNTKKSDYEDQGPPQSEIDKKYDDYKQSSQIAWCAVGLFAAVYVANWVDLIFFSQPDFGNRIGITDISNSFITLDINRPHSFISDNSEKNMHLGIGVRF
ncbi:MAG: hypothetical protein SVR08_12350, partial [Spirochaetota bacterium]|nr:hypothetical protein [Spirochaetota bacterium]